MEKITDAGALPPSILAIARQTRDVFGPGVRMLFAADEATGQTWGNDKADDPCGHQPLTRL